MNQLSTVAAELLKKKEAINENDIEIEFKLDDGLKTTIV